ncbi:sialate O-acetylesterase [Persicobacter diffluens]|uniref:9-O-acetylesterase n=1 Tax=Persicobacter diffluens TaxID=981 RepID=A0AAN4W4Z1_9BACT|nr:9-O-acetylesterase [Persicobacter diffluens]
MMLQLIKRFFLAVLLLVGFAEFSWAHVSLPGIFSDHMVLQQQARVKIWGWGKPYEMVKISTTWAPDHIDSVQVTSQSYWELEVQTPAAGGPYEMLIEGWNSIAIKDILIGEVWLGSGQSNMEWSVNLGIEDGEKEAAQANFEDIRFFTMPTSVALTPQQMHAGRWVKCTPATMRDFSAVLYFFGRDLHQELSAPVGLINASWGGTPIEVWMPEASVNNDRALREAAQLLPAMPWCPIEPGRVFNAMIHPIIPFKIKGAIWYQGESNVENAATYSRAFAGLINAWRSAWGSDFPFYFAQIAPYNGYGEDNVNGAIIRDQQRLVLDRVGHTGMVMISDIGNLTDIHPRNKVDVGRRFAHLAFQNDYGRTVKNMNGPQYDHFEVSKGKINVYFSNIQGDLQFHQSKNSLFELLTNEGEWLQAEAKIVKNMVVLNKPDSDIVGIRYAYKNTSESNITDNMLIPISTFSDYLEQF